MKKFFGFLLILSALLLLGCAALAAGMLFFGPAQARTGTGIHISSSARHTPSSAC